ncbi:serine hydrolase domain-containing protein [Actibacterium pelagium]|uniref:Beta-lactamase-related domain-containing protein n=1 Tax=Actibacterium pelagium TaxID=2029103 RepID=A0A917EK97_9RHOB|nr:serine hydrolase domain-containing protein [Actibacterium pelagium]GGE46683.1 hypothetical protein GCM10011517_13010 [Actibacterium pelagium]
MSKARHTRLVLAAAILIAAGGLSLWYMRFEKTTDTVTELLETYDIPGAVLAVGQPGAPIEVQAFGHRDWARTEPMLADDRLRLASLSKPVTAAAIHVLIQRGELTHETSAMTIARPDGDIADPRAEAVTIGQLLRHRAGFDRDASGHPFLEPRPQDSGPLTNCAPILADALEQGLDFAPGTVYAYSNVGYCWLEQVIEGVTGQDYETAVKSLLPELQGFSLEPSTITAHPNLRSEEPVYPNLDPRIIGAAGGWISDAASYAAFLRDAPAGRAADCPATEPSCYGDGWRHWPDGEISHYGTMPGAFSVALRFSDGAVVVGLFNARPMDDLALFDDFKRLATAQIGQ